MFMSGRGFDVYVGERDLKDASRNFHRKGWLLWHLEGEEKGGEEDGSKPHHFHHHHVIPTPW
jgi:hypothetical protein